MKIALVHDFLTQKGGAERVFELLCRQFPNADIYTSIYDPGRTIELGNRPVRTTYLQRIPSASKYFRLLAPFYYSAFRSLNLQDYDLILSSTSSFAKGVRKHPKAYHICFCHNVTRFLWDTSTYLKEYKDFQNFYPLITKIFQAMRKADLLSAQEPDLYIANSTTVARRIQEVYHKPALTVNYPINTDKFRFSSQKEEFYLASARLLSYKRIDIIVEAFNSLGLPLIIIGDGPERAWLEAKANKNISFLGYVSDDKRTQLLSEAKGVIVAALEDYGLVPVEANASGTPVIAYGAGGVLDTQIPYETGLFFSEQTSQSLVKTLLEFEKVNWNYEKIRKHAMDNFTESVFFENISEIMRNHYGEDCLALSR